MSLDINIVSKAARLARIGLTDGEKQVLDKDINMILEWVDSLKSVDIEGVVPMVNGIEGKTPLRQDVARDHSLREEVLANAPGRRGDFFTVPKVVE